MILIASGVFDEQHADKIMNTRLERLDKQEQKDFLQCVYKLNQPAEHNKNQLMQTLGELCTKADILNPLTLDTNLIKVDYVQYQSVWQGFLKLRQGGELLDSGLAIKCPVAAIHGDYDPHPAAGIKDVLSPIIKNFKFILLKKCGHYPWLEKDISTHFYQVLLDEIAC